MTTPQTLRHSKSLSHRYEEAGSGIGHWLVVGGAVVVIGGIAALIAFAF